ncbi:MAG: T9SS type A sorting domain-containing protein [Ferruginibacter sp.]
MKLNYKFLPMLIAGLISGFSTAAQTQLYAGNGGSIYISQGDSIYIDGDMDMTSGATVINNSMAGITLTGIARINGLMEYTASGNQYILPFNHQSMYISGSGNKILTSNINISTLLQLGGTAKLLTGSNILSLTGIGSSLTGVPAFGSLANSWIVTGNGGSGIGNTGLGGLKISGIGGTGRAGSVLFPVGPTTSSYDPVTISNTGTNDDFAVAVNDQSVPGAPAFESVNATWNIKESIPGGSNVTLGTQWNTGDESAGFIRAVSGIVHSNGTSIDYFANAGAAAGADPYTQTGTGFTTFSPFGVTSNAVVLPVTFLHVNAYPKGRFIQVDWDVAAETAINYYEVQASTTGISFQMAGKVFAKGNYSSRESYNWLDLHPHAGVNFYRIRSVGMNGSNKYSVIVKVNHAAEPSYTRIYPNPVTNKKMKLEFNNKPAGNYAVRIISNSGALVYENRIIYNGTAGYYTIQLPVTLTRGIYQVNIVEPDFSSTVLKMLLHD